MKNEKSEFSVDLQIFVTESYHPVFVYLYLSLHFGPVLKNLMKFLAVWKFSKKSLHSEAILTVECRGLIESFITCCNNSQQGQCRHFSIEPNVRHGQHITFCSCIMVTCG